MSSIHWHDILVSDYLLALLIPLVLFVLTLQILGSPQDLPDIIFGYRNARADAVGHFSVQRAAASYGQYAQLSRSELATMRKSYGRMSWAHRRIGYELGYTQKLARLEMSIDTNAIVSEAIANLAREEFADELSHEQHGMPKYGILGDIGRVRESLKHFVRDWSDEGRTEREKIFQPILDVLRDVPGEKRREMQVLVPGAGLGRLAWEISELGYPTTANELSFFMNLALRFLLSPEHTRGPNQHVLQPYASWFSHQRVTDTLFRKISFPDAVPRLSDNFVLAERDFLSLRVPKGTQGYDIVVTLFFIDTSLNVIETLEHIYTVLRPGGKWINLGPLLWTGGGQAAVELSLEEVLKLAETVGFDVSGEDAPELTRRRTVECEYTADKAAMMRWLYQAEFWVATKKL
ncbi:N2227-domain-containing protein [Dichomitus squalens]|uniref:N2227-domain-containing protein n=1 Tax=Dichomitus squalens TaxID=114155 RepID=A0A4Q9PNK2_9APHY|nr:N2227-domain-containing protein [Dichomitus squalens]